MKLLSSGSSALIRLLFIGSMLSSCVVTVSPDRPPPATSTSTSTATEAPAGGSVKFLLFQTAGNISPSMPVGGPVMISTEADIEKGMENVAKTIGETGDHVTRQLGVVIGPLVLDATDDQLRGFIDAGFQAAVAKDVAVGFHVDNSMFWNNRKDLWSDRNNVEWSDFNGTIVPHRIIGWVANGNATMMAPPMCYNSPAMVKEATRIARDVIGAEIAKGVRKLNAAGKGYLFAGVISGWETNGLVNDDGKNPKVYFGYCALSHAGYSANNPPKDQNAVLVGVVRDWITLWTKGLFNAGIPRNKIFTHLGMGADAPANFPDPVRDFFNYVVPESAFNKYSNPGFSVYGTYDESMYKRISAMGANSWGVSEGTAVGLNGVADTSGSGISAMEQYLAGAFNHGATYANVFGWGGDGNSEYGKATDSTAAMAAYRKFLSGEKLLEAPAGALGCPNPLPSNAPPLLSSLCQQLASAEQAGSIKYPAGPFQNASMLNSVISQQVSSGTYGNAESVIQMALSSK
jgi:hypothetical protein